MDVDEIVIDPLYNDLANTENLLSTELDLFQLGKGVQNSYFIVRNIAFDDELGYFLSDTGLPVYYSDEGVFKNIGNMSPNLNSVLRAKFLDTGVSYVNSNGDELDLSIPENLALFITIG